MRTWIKDPLAILAEGAERGIVVEGDRIVELIGAGKTPTSPYGATFNASRHVVIPGLVNTHHHFYQTLTRAHPAGLKARPGPVARRALSDLGAAAPRPVAAGGSHGAGRTAALGLHDGGRPSQPVSARARKRDRHRGRGGARAAAAHDHHARRDELLGQGRRAAAGQCRPGRRDGLPRLRAGPETVPRSRARLDDADRVRTLLAVRRQQALVGRPRQAVRAMQLPAAHASVPGRGRGAVLRRGARHAPGRLPGGDRLAEFARLDRARRPFQCGRHSPARKGRRRHQPLRGRRTWCWPPASARPRISRRRARRSASASTARRRTIRPT